MPCYDPRDDKVRTVIQKVDNPEVKRELMDALDRLNRVTQYLCFMIGESKVKEEYEELPTDIKVWSENHDVEDTERVLEKIQVQIKRGQRSASEVAKNLAEEALKVHPLSDYHIAWFYDLAKSHWLLK